jgi:hypothetical protein
LPHTFRREDRKRLEEAASKAASEFEQREKKLLEDLKGEKEGMRRAYDKQVGSEWCEGWRVGGELWDLSA